MATLRLKPVSWGARAIRLGDEPVSIGRHPDNTVRLLSIGAGPHASASLGVHAVDAGYFFVSDLHVPNSEADTPRIERAATECWFASWAVASLPPDTVVLNSHSTPQTPVARLEKYLQSETCRALAQ